MHRSTSLANIKRYRRTIIAHLRMSTLQMSNVSFNMSPSLLPHSHLLVSLQSWTHVGVVSHVPALVTLKFAKILLFLLHGCFLEPLDNFLHSFLLLLNYLLCHDEKLTLSGVMISSFSHRTCGLGSGTFFNPMNFFTIGTSILVSFT